MKHEFENSRVYNRDCVEAMQEYPDNYYSLAVCDPPYGMIGHTFRTKDKKFTNGFVSSALDKGELSQAKISLGERPEKEYFEQLYRVSKNQIVFGMQYYPHLLYPTQCVIIWDKPNGTSRFSDAEIAWTSFKTGVRIASRYFERGLRIHPTQKPVKLYDWIFKNYAKEGDKILDTHLGSQSSRISAYKSGLDFTGFELDEDYFRDGNKRFMNFTSQLTLDYKQT